MKFQKSHLVNRSSAHIDDLISVVITTGITDRQETATVSICANRNGPSQVPRLT